MQGREPFKGAVCLSVDCYRECSPATLQFGDWDNHGKTISDALNGICYDDDRQVVAGRIRLFKGEPRVVIEVEEVAPLFSEDDGRVL